MKSIYEQITMRPAVRADLSEIVRLLVEDELGQTREQYNPAHISAAYGEAWDKIEATAGNQIIVAELDGNIIGTFQLMYLPSLSYTGGTRAQIESVRVDKTMRNQGIGQRMMEWAIEQSRTAGCVLVQLSTNKQRLRAHRFYERLGFDASHQGMKLML